MPTLNEQNRLGDVLKWEADERYSRDVVTVNFAGAGTLQVGHVLGRITASGKYKASIENASDGTEVARAMLTEAITVAGAGDVKAVVIARDALVSKAGLVWDATYDSQVKKDAGMVELAGFGIIARDAA
jgi:hypothetical protein